MKYYRIRVKITLKNRPTLHRYYSVTCEKEAARILKYYRNKGLCTMTVDDA